MFKLPGKIVVWDSECTCWPESVERGWTGSGEHRELVQIGALLVDTEDFELLDEFDILVKPRIHTILSEYFIALTGITQEMVDLSGVGFPEGLRRFYEWCQDYNLYSWSQFDREVLIESCRINNIVLPFHYRRFFDIRMVFWKRQVDAEKYNSGTIVRTFNKPLPRRAHNALNDARTIVDGLKELSRQEWLKLFVDQSLESRNAIALLRMSGFYPEVIFTGEADCPVLQTGPSTNSKVYGLGAINGKIGEWLCNF